MSENQTPQHNKYVIVAGALAVVALVVGVVVYTKVPKRRIKASASSRLYDIVGAHASRKRGFAQYGLDTNTHQTRIALERVVSRGPGKDGIPSIDNPQFDFLSQLKDAIPDDMRGIVLQHDGITRYYPYNILVWHEIVNDQIGDLPVAITFCPLCESAIAYDRRIDDEVLEFGVSGLLYESNLLMYDRSTESLWSQIEGRAVIGDYVGSELQRVDITVISFAQAREQYPDMEVLTGYR